MNYELRSFSSSTDFFGTGNELSPISKGTFTTLGQLLKNDQSVLYLSLHICLHETKYFQVATS